MSSVANFKSGEAIPQKAQGAASGETGEAHPKFNDVVFALVGALDAAVSEAATGEKAPASQPPSATQKPPVAQKAPVSEKPSVGEKPESLEDSIGDLVRRTRDPAAEASAQARSQAGPSAERRNSLPKATPFEFILNKQTAASRDNASPEPIAVAKRAPTTQRAQAPVNAVARNTVAQAASPPSPTGKPGERSARVAVSRLLGVVKGKASQSSPAKADYSAQPVLSATPAATPAPTAGQALAQGVAAVAANQSVSLETALEGLAVEAQRKQRRRVTLLSFVSLAWLGSLGFGAYQIGGFEVFTRPWGLDEITSAAILALLPIGVFALVLNAVSGRGGQRPSRADVEEIDPAPLRLLSASMRSEIQTMTESLQKVITRSSDLEILIKSEIKALEGAYSENETRMRGIVNELSSQREAIISHVERVRSETQQLSETFADSSHSATVSLKALQEDLLKSLLDTCAAIEGRLSGSKAQLQEGVYQAVDAARSRLLNETKQLVTTFSEHSHELASVVSRAGMEHLGALTSNTQNLEAALAQNISENKKALEDGTRELSQSVSRASSHARDALVQTGQSVEVAIQQRVKSTSDVLSLAVNDVIEVISERAEKTEKLLQEEIGIEKRLSEQLARLQEINQALNGSGGSIASSILESATKAQSEISSCGQAVAVTIANRSKAINEAISKSGEELAATIISRGEAVERNLEEKINRLELVNEAIKRAGRDLSSSLTKSVAQVQNDIASSGRLLTTNIEQRGQEVNNAFVASGTKAEKLLAEYATTLTERISGLEEVGQSLKAAGVDLSENLVADLAKLKDEITVTGRSIVNAVADRSRAANEALSNSGEHLVNTLCDYTDQFEATVNERIDKLDTAFASRTDHFERSFTGRLERLHNLIGSLDSAGVDVNASIYESVASLREELSRLGDDVASKLVARGHAVSNALSTTIQTADEVLSEHQAQVNSVLGDRLEQLDSLMTKRTETLDAVLGASGDTLSEMNERLGQVLDERLEQLEEMVSKRESLMSDRLVELNNLMSERIDEELRAVNDRADSLNEVLSARAESFAALIESDDELARRVAARINEAASALQNAVETSEEVSQQNERSLMDRAARLIELNQVISERFDQEAATIEAKVESINAFTETQAEAFAQLIERDEKLAERLTMRLRAASAQFEEVGTSASQKLASVENNLTKQASEIATVVEAIAADARGLVSEVSARRAEAEALAAEAIKTAAPTRPSTASKGMLGLNTQPGAPPARTAKPTPKAKNRDGWMSDLLKRASNEDVSLVVDDASRRRSPPSIPATDARGVISSLSSNIDHIIGTEEAYEYWAEISLDSIPLRNVVGDFGQRVYKYLADALADPAIARGLKAHARTFKHTVLKTLEAKGEKALIEFLVSVDGRVGTLVADAVGTLPDVLDALAGMEDDPVPPRQVRRLSGL